MTTEKFPGDLRDWFAGQAMNAIISKYGLMDHIPHPHEDDLASIDDHMDDNDLAEEQHSSESVMAYEVADTMLIARGAATPEPDWRGVVTSLLDIIHDDLTHERQAAHAAALTAARRAVGRA